ncbi:MAG TPA: LacI family DNA-binding transcriptional regulator [Phnomibacter sp.]|nr:LacI family DNA-binding transcriptional regulator [Phnomibacter sp.]
MRKRYRERLRNTTAKAIIGQAAAHGHCKWTNTCMLPAKCVLLQCLSSQCFAMKFEAVTIKDIAKALGFSTSTVSRALRDSYEISEETKALIMETAEKLNYKPNPIALGLKERRTRTLGVIVCEVANPFFSQVINGIQNIANSRGYNIIITQSHESYEQEVDALHLLSSRSVDGMLISLSTETNDMAHFKEMAAKGLPIVFFDRVVSDLNTHAIVLDNFKGAYDLTEHLIKQGFKRIAALASSEYLSITTERVAGYQEAMQAYGLDKYADMVQYCFYSGMDFTEVEDAMNKLLSTRSKPEAIVCLSDKLTTGSMRTLKRRGLKVPDDIALCGFLNTDLAELFDPPLTVVRQPAYDIGKGAVELLLHLVESKRPVTQFERRVLAPELIVRQSTLKKG